MRSITSLALAILAAGCYASEGRADVMLQSQFQGGTSVSATYSKPPGTTTKSTTAGAFTATPTSPSGSPFDAYCVSLGISVGSGPDNIKITSVQSLHSVGQSFFTDSQYVDVGNRLEFLLDSYGGGSANDKRALALAIWHTIDKNFSYTGGTAPVNALYNQFIQFTGYVSGTVYEPNAKLFVVNQGYKPYQNLIGLSAVPEPASVVLAGLGLSGVGLIAIRRARRRDS